nr:hypothetical protein CFP56_16507 [Quercus suber]POF04896.1 hypothetical protein CFP56_73857 [Quercus suber]
MSAMDVDPENQSSNDAAKFEKEQHTSGPPNGQAQPKSNSFFAKDSVQWLETLPRDAHVDRFRACDFGSTSLGPLRDWGPALRMYASMIFADSRGCCVYWGPDRIAFYNEKFSVNLADREPYTMGKSLAEAMPTVWDQFRVVFDQVQSTGRPVDVDDILIYIDRQGFLEETFFIGQFLPLRGDTGEIEGFYNTTFESTSLVLHRRRRMVVDRLNAIPPHLAVDEVINEIIEILRGNPKDIPMAMLYAYDEFATPGGQNIFFRGGIGVSPGINCATPSANLESVNIGLMPYFRQVQASGKPLRLSQSDGSLQATTDLFDGVSWCGFGEAARDIVISPLLNGGHLFGFFVQGMNPRRLYDEAAAMSVVDINRQVEARWLSSITVEQAKLREQNLERRATDSESRLKHMAQHAPFGMFQITPDRKIRWANQQFYDITGQSTRKSDVETYIADVLAREERADAFKTLNKLLNGEECASKEVRLQRSWVPPGKKLSSSEHEDTEKYSAWVLELKFPLIENGKVKLIMGYVIDISHQKWAESVQIHNAASAAEAKRRQEVRPSLVLSSPFQFWWKPRVVRRTTEAFFFYFT